MEMMVNYALTGRMTDAPTLIVRDNPHFKRPCCQLNVPVRPGAISVLEGIEEIESIPGVLNVTRNHKVGDDIKGDNSLGEMCLRIHIAGESKSEVYAIINRINGLIRIQDQNGCDMVLERYRYAF